MVESKEEKKAIVLAVTIAVLCSKNCLFILPFIAGFIPTINVAVSIAVLLLFAYEFKQIFFSAGIQVLTFMFAFLFCLIAQFAIFPQNSSILKEDIVTIVFYGAIPFMMASSIKDYDCFLFYLRKAALFIVCISIICAAFYLTSSMNMGYSMSFSNSAVVGVSVLEVFAFNTKKKTLKNGLDKPFLRACLAGAEGLEPSARGFGAPERVCYFLLSRVFCD